MCLASPEACCSISHLQQHLALHETRAWVRRGAVLRGYEAQGLAGGCEGHAVHRSYPQRRERTRVASDPPLRGKCPWAHNSPRGMSPCSHPRLPCLHARDTVHRFLNAVVSSQTTNIQRSWKRRVLKSAAGRWHHHNAAYLPNMRGALLLAPHEAAQSCYRCHPHSETGANRKCSQLPTARCTFVVLSKVKIEDDPKAQHLPDLPHSSGRAIKSSLAIEELTQSAVIWRRRPSTTAAPRS